MLETPDPQEFLEHFGVEPSEADPADGYWCYEFRSSDGLSLRFSYSVHETSVQAELSVAGRVCATMSREGATAIRIRGWTGGPRILVIFDGDESAGTANIQVTPAISIKWASLHRR